MLTLLPVFYISRIEGGRPYWERYLYLSSTGFVIAAAYHLRYPEGKFKKIFIGLIVSIAGLYSAETIQRNTVWKDDYSILSDVVKKSPDDSEARLHLGYEKLNRGEIDDAIFHLQKAIDLNSPDLRTYLFLGDAYFGKGFSNEAIQTYRTLIALKPGIFEAHRALELIYDSISYPEEAIREYEAAVSLRPGDAECLRRIEEIRKTHPR